MQWAAPSKSRLQAGEGDFLLHFQKSKILAFFLEPAKFHVRRDCFECFRLVLHLARLDAEGYTFRVEIASWRHGESTPRGGPHAAVQPWRARPQRGSRSGSAAAPGSVLLGACR